MNACPSLKEYVHLEWFMARQIDHSMDRMIAKNDRVIFVDYWKERTTLTETHHVVRKNGRLLLEWMSSRPEYRNKMPFGMSGERPAADREVIGLVIWREGPLRA
jgi:hypothetical protein